MMKKIKVLFIVSLVLFLFIGCGSEEKTSVTSSLNIFIQSDVDTFEVYKSSVSGITLTPKLERNIDEDVEFHWTIDSDTEMFDTESGPQKEIINSGESVLVLPVAEISYIEPDKLAKVITVTLVVEDKNSNEVLAKTELFIDDYSGTYKVKK